MTFTRFIQRPVLSTVISVLIVILGILGLLSLPIEQYPNIAPPTVVVYTTYAGADAKKVSIDLSRFKGMKKVMTKTVLSGQPDDENNFEKQPIAPKTETLKAKKKIDLDLDPYSFVMLQVSL